MTKVIEVCLSSATVSVPQGTEVPHSEMAESAFTLIPFVKSNAVLVTQIWGK